MTEPGVAVFVTNSPLHLIYARALVEHHRLERYEIHWFGKPAATTPPWFSALTRDLIVRDFSQLQLNDFRGLVRGRRAYLEEVGATVDVVSLLYTCHNVHPAYETLRRRYRVPWARVGVIEDGIGSYSPWRMLPLRRQVVRAAVAVVAVGHPLSVARWDVGGDPRFGYVSTIGPGLVHLHPESRATVVDLRDSVRRALDELAFELPAAYTAADVLLFLPPVLQSGRLTPAQLAEYVARVCAHAAVEPDAAVVVKPHPRDQPEAVRAALATAVPRLTVGGDEPIELHLGRISVPLWAGSPSSSMLNNALLYPGRDTRYVLFPVAGNRNVPAQVEVLRRVLGDALVDVAPVFPRLGRDVGGQADRVEVMEVVG